MCPCRAFHEWVFVLFFFPPDIWVFVFFWIFGSEGIPHFQQNILISKRLGRGTLNTCAKFQGLSLKNGVDIWTVVRKVQKSRLGIVITWFYCIFDFGRATLLNIGPTYAVSFSKICAKLCTSMPWTTWKRLVQKQNSHFFFFTVTG